MKFLIPLLVACSGSSTPTPSDTDPATVPTDTDDTDVVLPTADTGHTDLPGPPEVDCTTPPSAPFDGRRLETPRAYHGLDFDVDGFLVGSDGTNLLKSDDTASTSIFIPNIGFSEQMAYLDNGDLAIAMGGPIQVIAPNGARSTVASGINAYGVDIGPDQFIYTANQNVVHRVDPSGTVAAQVFLPQGALPSPKVITFNLEGTEMFVGTNFSNGQVHRFDLDTDGTAILPGTLIGNTGGSWHDGLDMDACGRLYVAEYNTRSLYMLEEGQGSTQLIDYYDSPIGGQGYGHGLVWGNGVGNWDDHKLYVPLPYNGNRIAEINLGVPAKHYNGGHYTRIE